MDAVTNVPVPANEPIKGYAPGSPERAALESKIKELAGERAELTMTIGGEQRMGGGERVDVVQPHNHRHVLGQLGNATDEDVTAAIEAARPAAPGWRELSFDDRAAIFLKAADLLAGPWRPTINAATILGQSKSVLPGRDRRGLRADRLLALQRALRPAAARRAAGLGARHAGTGSSTARSKASCWRSRRSTSPRSRATCRPRPRCWATWWSGSRRRTQQLSAHYLMRAAGGGRAAARRDQHGDRQRPGRVPGRAAAPGPGRDPLHRLDRDVPAPVADRGREHRRLPRLPAAGRARPAARTS